MTTSRPAGSLSAVDLGKTVTLGDRTGILTAVEHHPADESGICLHIDREDIWTYTNARTTITVQEPA